MTLFNQITELWIFMPCLNRFEPPKSVSNLNPKKGYKCSAKLSKVYYYPSFVKFQLGFPCLASRASLLWRLKILSVPPKTFCLINNRTETQKRELLRSIEHCLIDFWLFSKWNVFSVCVSAITAPMSRDAGGWLCERASWIGHIYLGTHAVVVVTRCRCHAYIVETVMVHDFAQAWSLPG